MKEGTHGVGLFARENIDNKNNTIFRTRALFSFPGKYYDSKSKGSMRAALEVLYRDNKKKNEQMAKLHPRSVDNIDVDNFIRDLNREVKKGNFYMRKRHRETWELYSFKEIALIAARIQLNSYGVPGCYSVFSTLSAINHSCKSNSDVTIHRGVATLSSKKRIKTGNEITFNYLSNLRKPKRHVALLNDYYFSCNCAKTR